MKRILVALDSSSRAPGVVAAAVDLAAKFNSTIYPLRVLYVPPEFPAAAGGGAADPLPSHMVNAAAAQLTGLFSGAAHLDVAAPLILLDSHPWKGILKAGDDLDVDLIVMGSHGHNTLDIILGTTAAKVANLAQRNVLVVHGRPTPPGNKNS
jgi:nucleotide-binding universal stress UspA family protein